MEEKNTEQFSGKYQHTKFFTLKNQKPSKIRFSLKSPSQGQKNKLAILGMGACPVF